MHSVRDEYTKKQLFSIGIKNVINTGCPTMWQFTPEFCDNVPTMKAKSVVFTLTDYNKDRKKDIFLIETLKKAYDSVSFWPQGMGDLTYMDSLGQKGIHIISPNLDSYDKLLHECDSLDYIGTRLHAGIRALQHKRRAVIIAVDNRATEIHKDTNIPIISRSDIHSLPEIITSDIKTEISLKESNIKKWKAQFEAYNESING
jgi:polysaccharide pyruvyl transferase WcaK-like protein